MDYDSPSAQEFADVMQAEQLVDLQKLKDLARRGVPIDVRGDVWMYLLGVLAADTSNEQSLIRERLAEYDSLNKSNQKLEQTIRHECSRYYQRRLVAKWKPGKPKRPAVRTTEQPDREQAAAAELKTFTDKTESIICAYLNSKHVALTQQHHSKDTRLPVDSATSHSTGAPATGRGGSSTWETHSVSIPTRPSSRAYSEASSYVAAQSSTAGSRTGSAAGMASDHQLSSDGRPPTMAPRRADAHSSTPSSEDGHSRFSSGHHTGLSPSHLRLSSDQPRPLSDRRVRDRYGNIMSEASDSEDGGRPPPRPASALPIYGARDDRHSDAPSDERDFSSLGTTPASAKSAFSPATTTAAMPGAYTSSSSQSHSPFMAATSTGMLSLATLPDAFQPTTTNSNPHVQVFPDIQPDFHPALVSLCAPFVECIRNETGMYFSFARLMQMLEHNNARHPLTERVSTFLTLLRTTLPELYAYFEEEEVDIVGFATRWLQDLLSAEMRINDVLRLWDVYFAQPEPLELHLYVCVAILMVLKDQLEELDHSECKSMLNALPDLDVELIVNEAINIRLSQQQSVDDDDF